MACRGEKAGKQESKEAGVTQVKVAELTRMDSLIRDQGEGKEGIRSRG